MNSNETTNPRDGPREHPFYVTLGGGRVALVDEADWEDVKTFSWRPIRGYAIVRDRAKMDSLGPGLRFMHRFVMRDVDIPEGYVIDHINGSGLDNRRANLRVCTHQENIWSARWNPAANKTGYLGVQAIKLVGGGEIYAATLRIGGRSRNIGRYATAKEAALAYDIAAREHRRGPIALNFPDEEPGEPPTRIIHSTSSRGAWSNIHPYPGGAYLQIDRVGLPKVYIGRFTNADEAASARDFLFDEAGVRLPGC